MTQPSMSDRLQEEHASFARLRDKVEPLHEELDRCVRIVRGETFISHPLYHNYLFGPADANDQYRTKKTRADKARSEGNWHAFVFEHERAYRMQVLSEIAGEIPDEAYWPLVGEVWIDIESTWHLKKIRNKLLNSKRSGRDRMMDSKERDALARLPDPVPIYRGFGGVANMKGWSWTTDKAKAEWFAQRFRSLHKMSRLAIATCKKEDVVAYLLGRKEFEIVINPRFVKIIEVIDV